MGQVLFNCTYYSTSRSRSNGITGRRLHPTNDENAKQVPGSVQTVRATSAL